MPMMASLSEVGMIGIVTLGVGFPIWCPMVFPGQSVQIWRLVAASQKIT
jgi:hypothetical protein